MQFSRTTTWTPLILPSHPCPLKKQARYKHTTNTAQLIFVPVWITKPPFGIPYTSSFVHRLGNSLWCRQLWTFSRLIKDALGLCYRLGERACLRGWSLAHRNKKINMRCLGLEKAWLRTQGRNIMHFFMLIFIHLRYSR